MDIKWFVNGDMIIDGEVHRKVGEQLEQAQDKENRCYNEKCKDNDKNGFCKLPQHFIKVCEIRDTKQPIPINYEEEYNKLKKEFRELNDDYTNVVKSLRYSELKSKDEKNKELEKGRDTLNQRLNVAYSENTDLKNQIEELDGVLLSVETDRDSLLKTNEELKEKVVELANENNSLKDLKSAYEDSMETMNEGLIELNKENQELKKQNNQDYMEQINTTINEKNEEIERLSKLTNEYYYNWVEEQKKNKIMESDLIKYESTIKNQREVIKTLASLL